MSDAIREPDQPDAVDDVRQVRERLSREAGGDMARLAADATAEFERLREQLKLNLVKAPSPTAKTAAAGQ